MPLDFQQLAICMAILFVASVVQSAIGFGMGLVAAPVMMMAGLPLSGAVAVLVCSAMMQASVASYKLREHIPWRYVLTGVPVRVIAIVAGLTLLARVDLFDPARVRQYVGFVLLAAVVLQAVGLRKRPSRSDFPWPVTAVAYGVSGLMAGFCGMGGPPLVLWANSLDWPAERTRSFLLTSFAMSGVAQMLLLYWRFGSVVFGWFAVSVISLVAMLAGTAIGLRIGKRIDAARLRVIALIVLAVLAVSSIATPYLK